MEDYNFTVTEENTSLEQCQISVFFLGGGGMCIEGIVHKVFVPPGQTVNGKFCCDLLRCLRESVRHKRPDRWRNNSWALHHCNAVARTSEHDSHSPPSLLTRPDAL